MRARAAFTASILAILLATAGCGPRDGAADAAPSADAPLVEVIAAAPASASGAVRASGLVAYRRETNLAFTAAGLISSLSVDAGDRVRRGQQLAALQRTGPGATVDEAALARQNAERDLERTQTLYDRGFVSEARLEDARLAVARARDSSVLTAPADGVILRRHAERSQMIAAGAPVFAFGEVGSGFVVRAPVATSEAARIRVGDSASVTLSDFAGVPRTGRVTRVGAKSNDVTGAFEVEVQLDNAVDLRSGLVAEIDIAGRVSANETNALLVPTLSLLDARADQGVVFVVDADGIARRRSVRTGGVTQAGVLVLDGLTEGDHVVAAGAAYVRDGEPVRIAPGPG